MGAVFRRPYRNYPRRQLWLGFRAHTRGEWRELGKVAGAVAVAIAVAVALNRNFFGGYIAGFLSAFLIAMITWNYLINDDGLRYLNGAWAEDWTREELKKAVQRREAWVAVDNVPLPGGDVDHVLITPAGVLAVETKFYGTAGRAKYLHESVADAERAATRVRALLTTIKSPAKPVLPVLVVWGKGGRGLEQLPSVDGVHVVRGHELESRLKAFATGRLAQDHAYALADDLRRYVKGLAHRP